MALTFGGKRRKPGGGPPAEPLSPAESSLVRRLVGVMNTLAGDLNTRDWEAAIANVDPDLLERLMTGTNIEAIGKLLEKNLAGVVLSGATDEAKKIIRNAPRVNQNPVSALGPVGTVLPSGIIIPTSMPSIPDVEFLIERPMDRMFKFMNEKAVDYARTRSAQLVRSIDESNRLAIRQLITRAFTEPRTGKQTARSIREIIGLHPRWAMAVERFKDQNFRNFVQEGMATDAATAKSELMAEKYRGKLIRRRAEMIARTEIQTAQNFGREASWVASERVGLVDPRSEKQWVTAPGGSRYGPPCDECMDMRDVRVPWNGVFPNGFSMPPAHPNCRCTAVLVAPVRGLTGLPSQDMGSWIAELDRLEAEGAA